MRVPRVHRHLSDDLLSHCVYLRAQRDRDRLGREPHPLPAGVHPRREQLHAGQLPGPIRDRLLDPGQRDRLPAGVHCVRRDLRRRQFLQGHFLRGLHGQASLRGLQAWLLPQRDRMLQQCQAAQLRYHPLPFRVYALLGGLSFHKWRLHFFGLHRF